jgi:hypothetical protein
LWTQKTVWEFFKQGDCIDADQMQIKKTIPHRKPPSGFSWRLGWHFSTHAKTVLNRLTGVNSGVSASQTESGVEISMSDHGTATPTRSSAE